MYQSINLEEDFNSRRVEGIHFKERLRTDHKMVFS